MIQNHSILAEYLNVLSYQINPVLVKWPLLYLSQNPVSCSMLSRVQLREFEKQLFKLSFSIQFYLNLDVLRLNLNISICSLSTQRKISTYPLSYQEAQEAQEAGKFLHLNACLLIWYSHHLAIDCLEKHNKYSYTVESIICSLNLYWHYCMQGIMKEYKNEWNLLN